MDDAGLAAHLAALGLAPAAADLYLRLLAEDGRDGGEGDGGGSGGGGDGADGPASGSTDGSPDGFVDAADSGAAAALVDAGLAAGPPDGCGPLVPVPPDGALELLAGRRALRLAEARAAVTGAYERYRRRTPAVPCAVAAEEATGAEAERRIGEALAGARQEVLCFDPPPYPPSGAGGGGADGGGAGGAGGTAAVTALLRRGVRHRVVYTRAALARPGYLTDRVQPRVDAGEEARVLAELPVGLTIVDDRVAFVGQPPPACADARGGVHVVLVVRPGALLTALRALFGLLWERALPLQPPGPARSAAAPPASGGAYRPGPAERRILAMLVAGVPDSQIIRELGVSRRTFFRRMERLMTHTGATSRFQLALHAQRRGWL
ncbi:helix-turn-helix transcriptional regulator [Streptomyces sp. TRM 70351]|uniref:helix-turn-helix transcriptional regulator n=1 Tax=Streptomyces sp. TRM 70351 TaxID=3116552 RepID=UPI002E7AC00B|nr:helix-turn-helix transcriptional regulator [Streptomyces sp. TRM 70351]MEE1929556.1 helix-turn-helix transcriptional regulator [Streptomyces sp. TRM 70351]